MKVLMIEHYLPDSIYTLELGRELKNYCNLSVLCRANADCREEGITWIPQLYAGGRGKVRAVLEYGISLLKLAAVIIKGKYDVVHIQTFKNAKYEMLIYHKLRKYFKTLILTIHNVLPHETQEKDIKLYKEFYEFCDGLIVHNKSTESCLIEKFKIPKSKITVIAHGAYQTHLNSVCPPRDNTEKCFLQFGVIRKYKGIDILLDAIARIEPEKRKSLRFIIAGEQYPKLDNTDYRKRISELGIEECVSFTQNYIPEEELPRLFGKADFLLFPYKNIYGSGALLLAYTYNKPVIVSNIPTFQEETDGGKTGILFESENPQALADAILQAAACSEEQIQGYQSAIRKLISEKYNWKKSAKKTAEVYKNN